MRQVGHSEEQTVRHSERSEESKKTDSSVTAFPQNDMQAGRYCEGVKRVAFTLAEVLITLGIIGVVAAMTIPTLIANYQKTQTVTKLKKAYAELAQAFKQAEVEHGSGWNFAGFETQIEEGKYFAENYLFPNMKTANVCIPSSSVCWADIVYNIKGIANNSTIIGNQNSKAISFVTLSGYSVYFWLHAIGTGGWFYIDINGKQKPNIIGKDIFVFVATFDESDSYDYKLGLFPAGMQSRTDKPTRQQLKDSCIGGGSHCGALIMNDGWKISPDYPW